MAVRLSNMPYATFRQLRWIRRTAAQPPHGGTWLQVTRAVAKHYPKHRRRGLMR